VEAATNPINVDVNEYISHIKLPPGFSISVYSDKVPGARSMALSARGTLFVGTLSETFGAPAIGKVYALRDDNHDNKADEVIPVADKLNYPNGVAVHGRDLYVAEISRILRYSDIDKDLKHPPQPAVINDSYPTDYHHGWKFIRFGPDGRLYVPVGAPCNTCMPDENHALITSIKPDGSDKQVFARGIRNSVGFDWDPETGEMWFTDNGRDGWGNDIPPEELNHAPRAGLHFGFPYRYGKQLVDYDYQTDMKAADFTPPALELPAHNAALGLRFYRGSMFPAKYKNRIFIAAHGSWNRGVPDGYCIYVVTLKDNKVAGYEKFASGWLTQDKHFWGRPVDVQELPDGSLLVSDDHAGAIYRINYEK
jgi:glucose/arabinose dehydrogenase